MKVSILCLTWDRSEITKQAFKHNIENCGLDKTQYEILVCDQGSKDLSLLQWITDNVSPVYFRTNSCNEGIARSLNQLIIRAKGEYLFFMPSDILLPPKWLLLAVGFAQLYPRTGIVGFDGQDLKHPQRELIPGMPICMANDPLKDPTILEGSQIFGATLMTRKLIDSIGGFCEDYHPYGLEDSDYCFRAVLAGFWIYYIPGARWQHLGHKEQEDPAYSAFKKFSFESNLGLHRFRIYNYNKVGFYESLPMPKYLNGLLQPPNDNWDPHIQGFRQDAIPLTTNNP